MIKENRILCEDGGLQELSACRVETPLIQQQKKEQQLYANSIHTCVQSLNTIKIFCNKQTHKRVASHRHQPMLYTLLTVFTMLPWVYSISDTIVHGMSLQCSTILAVGL